MESGKKDGPRPEKEGAEDGKRVRSFSFFLTFASPSPLLTFLSVHSTSILHADFQNLEAGMPSKKAPTSDLVRRLGLIAPLTKQRTDWDLQPAVKELYAKGIDTIAKHFYLQSNEDIRASRDLRHSALTLLRKHAPVIWADGPRSWLLRPDDERSIGLYPNQLYWSDPSDCECITSTFHELVVEKVMRSRKDNIKSRLSSVTSDPAWAADGPLRQSIHVTDASKHFKCFASDTPRHDHTDAAPLKDRGVWLGDYNEEDDVVISLSYCQVIEKYYESTEGGVHKDSSEGPHVNAWHSLEADKDMWCVACKASGREAAPGVIAEHIQFVYESDANTFVAEPMRKTVWIFPCTLGDRKVFALLKCEKLRYESTCLWSFWKVDGSYTKDIFVTVAPKQPEQTNAVVQNNSSSQLVRKVETEETGGESALQNPYELRPRRSRPYGDSGIEVEQIQYEIEGRPQLQRQDQSTTSDDSRGAHVQDQQAGLGAEPSRSLPEHSAGTDQVARGEREPTVDDLARELRLEDIEGRGRKRRANSDTGGAPSRQRRRMDETQQHGTGTQHTSTAARDLRGYPRANHDGFDEDYDVTPGAEDRRRRGATNAPVSAQADGTTPSNMNDGFFKRFAAPSANTGLSRTPGPQDAPAAAPAASSSAEQAAAAPGNELKVRFKVREREGISIVKLSKSTTVQEAFAAIEKRFVRKLEGSSVQALRFAFPSELLDVELDDSDTWEDVLLKLAQVDADASLSTFEALVEV